MAEVPLPTPTQAPVPSTDIRNAVFAGAKLDEEVNGTGEFYTDRLGVKRLTNTGRNNQFDAAQLDRANRFEQFLLSSGYVFLGDYEDGPFQFSARNQYIRYNNQYYRLNAATDVGFTTTGTDATSFVNDVTHFVLMDGDTLRQNLGSNEWELGGYLVALFGGGNVQQAIGFFTPERFGAVGDGVTDDYHAIQRMFDSIPPYSVVQLRSGSVYYNAFANDGTWRDLKLRSMWRITKPATIIGNGALFTRRQPKWNDANAKNNSNSGPGYTDQDTAVLYSDNVDYLNIENLRIDGSNPVGAIKNTAGQDTGATGYAQCECRDFGIYVEGGSRIRMTGVDIKNCCFNILGFGVNDIKIEGRLYQSGQAWKMISSDLALGAGVKLMNCTKFKLDIVGHHNTNATAEIEPNNIDGDIGIRSSDDYANGMVIYDSKSIDYKAKITGVKSGSGVQIIHGNNGQPTKNITGKMYIDGASWCGLQIRMTGNALFDMKDINIDYVGENCSLADYWADQTPAIATGKTMRNINVNVLSDGWSIVDGGPKISGYSVRISGVVGGKTTGKIRNTNIGFLCDNGNNASDPHYARLDLTERVSIPYSVGANNYVDWFGTVTANQMMLMSRAPKLMMARAAVSAGEQDYAEIYMRSPLIRFANLPIDPASKSPFQLYSHQAVENSVNTYTLRINY
ncbi:hypothetical protein VZC42_17075 [Raoultella ornithinolytica]|uniref:hypothetical protein n=1 Tax=Raoultella ornithinolytica TaxID=54291 RepID=UPI0038A7D81E